MKIDVCLVTSNENPDYYIFYPYVKPIWEKLLNVKCILIYIGESLPKILQDYKDDIILFKPIRNIHTAFIAQNIRLLYPCLMDQYQNGILISDIDAIPLNGSYFTEKIESYDNGCFISYSFDSKVELNKEHNMSYNVAVPSIWKNIFNISTIDDVTSRLLEWYKKVNIYYFDPRFRSKCKGFHFDQKIFYQYLKNWKDSKTKTIMFNLSERKRLREINKTNENIVLNRIKNQEYDDFIFLRPYQKHLSSKLKIKELLLN